MEQPDLTDLYLIAAAHAHLAELAELAAQVARDAVRNAVQEAERMERGPRSEPEPKGNTT